MEPLQALTAAVLCGLPLQYPRPVRSAYIRDFVAALSCLLLHLRKPATLSLSFAIAYVVWTLVPGSFSSLTLPSYATFKRATSFVEPKDESDECKVCWDTAHLLAQLPCGHHVCEGCLELMNEHFQTACPTCRRPLFCVHDRAVFVLTKASATCGAVNIVLHFLVGVYELRSAAYYHAIFSIGFSYAIGRYHLWLYWILISEYGENWWRGSPAATRGESAISLQRAGLASVTGIVLLFQTLWTSRECFS